MFIFSVIFFLPLFFFFFCLRHLFKTFLLSFFYRPLPLLYAHYFSSSMNLLFSSSFPLLTFSSFPLFFIVVIFLIILSVYLFSSTLLLFPHLLKPFLICFFLVHLFYVHSFSSSFPTLLFSFSIFILILLFFLFFRFHLLYVYSFISSSFPNSSSSSLSSNFFPPIPYSYTPPFPPFLHFPTFSSCPHLFPLPHPLAAPPYPCPPQSCLIPPRLPRSPPHYTQGSLNQRKYKTPPFPLSVRICVSVSRYGLISKRIWDPL